jgi:hypothetical protein
MLARPQKRIRIVCLGFDEGLRLLFLRWCLCLELNEQRKRELRRAELS